MSDTTAAKQQTVIHTNRWLFALNVGFFAGLIWGGVRIVFYVLQFTKILPAFLVEAFFKKYFMHSWNGHMVGWLFFTLFSIFASFVYTLFFYKLKGPWPGIFYGMAWWGILFLYLGPVMGMVPWINHLDINSILSELCVFSLWGVFIGYSITVEFTDEQIREPI